MEQDEDLPYLDNNADTAGSGNGERGMSRGKTTEDEITEACEDRDSTKDGRMVCIYRSKIVVYMGVCFYMKSDLDRANAEVVCLNTDIALLTKCNVLLELQCKYLQIMNMTLRMNELKEHTDNRQSRFHSVLNLRVLLYCFEDIHSIFKDDGVQLTFHACFSELYARIFLLIKITTTETT